jgi:ATP-dependent Clp protease ATP-binding subunit ClpC
MFERFTEDARRVLVTAQHESRALRHNYIGTEHFLLAMLRDVDGTAASVLHLFDISFEEVKEQVRRVVGEEDEVSTDQIPFTPRAKKVLGLSMNQAVSLGSDSIGSEHILLAIVAERECVAARILRDFDTDAAMIRREVRLLDLRRDSPKEAPREPDEPI